MNRVRYGLLHIQVSSTQLVVFALQGFFNTFFLIKDNKCKSPAVNGMEIGYLSSNEKKEEEEEDREKEKEEKKKHEEEEVEETAIKK